MWPFILLIAAIHTSLQARDKAQTISLSLKDNYETTNETITLEEVLTCNESTICQELYAFTVFSGLAPGKTAIITNGQIFSLLTQEWPDLHFKLSGQKTKLTNNSPLLSELEIETQASQILKELVYDKENYQITLAYFKPTTLLSIPKKARLVIPHFKEIMGNELVFLNRYRHKNQVKILFIDQEKTYEASAILQLKGNVRCPVAKENIGANKTIFLDQLALVWKELSELQGQFIVNEKDIVGKTTATPIGVNDFFKKSQLKKTYAVQRGQVLPMRYDSGHVDITIPVKVLMDGEVFDTIDVKNLRGDKTLRALIGEGGVLSLAKKT